MNDYEYFVRVCAIDSTSPSWAESIKEILNGTLGMARSSEYVTLSGYMVKIATTKAVAIVRDEDNPDEITWLPRSACQDGDVLAEGDTDLVVARWKADLEGLNYD